MAMPKPQKPRLAAVETPQAPPHATDAEQHLIGILLCVPERFQEVAGLVVDTDFYLDSHRRIWRHVSAMAEAGEVIDVVTVSDRIGQFNEIDQTGGLAYLGEMAQVATPSANVAAYARIIADRAQRRQLMALADEIATMAHSAGAGSGSERVLRAASMLSDLSARLAPTTPTESVLEVSPAAIIDQEQVFTDELVEDVLTASGVSVVYGASNSGKTFFAIDLAAAVARGVPWNEKNTRKTAVLYLATESPASVKNRISAYMRHHDIDMLDLFVASKPINLFESDADVGRVQAEIEHIRAAYDVEIGLIVGDTMARIAAGANENAGEDMGVVMANADKLCRATRCAFMWIHHSGKDEAKGARGWSGIRAHIDTEIEIKDANDDGVHSAEITKQRDLPGKGARFGFRLSVQRLGLNAWGNVRTTCVVTPEHAPEKAKGGRPNDGESAVLVFLRERGAGAKSSDIVDGLEGVVTRMTVFRALKSLTNAGKLDKVSGIYAVRGS